MEKLDIIGFAGVVVGMLGFITYNLMQRRVLLLVSILSLLAYSLLKPIYPFSFLLISVLAYYVYFYVKAHKSKSSIKLFEVEYDSTYIVEFISNYKRDIYNYFPFYEPHESHKCFLIMRDLNLAGILIVSITKETMTIEVDYTKPKYRDKEIGVYIYKKNPGYFKNLGVNKLVAKSFHKGHSKFLKKMGFVYKSVDSQMFFVKNLD